MSKVIIEAINSPSLWLEPGTTAVLRAEAIKGFTTSSGQFIPPSNGNKLYLEVPISIAGNVPIIESFEIDSTEDAMPWDSSLTGDVPGYRFTIVTSRGKKIPYFLQCKIPVLTGADTSFIWSELRRYNRAFLRRRTGFDALISAPEVLQWIQDALGSRGLASETNLGLISLLNNPVDPSNPIALGPNSPSVAGGFVIYTSKYNSLDDANAAIVSLGGGTIVVDASTPLIADVVVDALTALRFEGQGILTGAATVTIAGPLESPPKQIFGTGITVLFTGNKVVKEVYPEWWGAVGTADDGPVFQAAATAFKVLALQPQQNYVINSTVTAFVSSVGGRILGNGATISTTFDGTLFNINSVTDFKAGHLKFIGDYNYPIDALKINQKAFTSNPCGDDIEIHDVNFVTMTGGMFFADGGSNVRFRNIISTATLAPIQHGGGATTKIIRITDFYFVGSTTLNMDDAIAISGSAEDVVIANGVIDQLGNPAKTTIAGEGVLIESSSSGLGIKRVNISNVHVLNAVSAHVLQANTGGINIETAAGALPCVDVVITDCFVDGAYKGIKVGDGANEVSIKGGSVRNTVDAGIRSDGVGAVFSVAGTRVRDTGDHGIAVVNAATASVIQAIVKNAGLHGIFATTNTGITKIIGNDIDGSAFDGIQTDDDKAIIALNHSNNNGRYGLNLGGAVNPYVIGNKFSGNVTAPIFGYSATSTNLRGAIAFPGAGQVTVIFAEAEPDADYYPQVTPSANENVWISDLTTAGFKINSSNAASTMIVFWEVTR